MAKKKPEPKIPTGMNISPLAERLQQFGVSPYQPGMPAELSGELRGIAAEQNIVTQEAIKKQNIQAAINVSNQQVAAQEEARKKQQLNEQIAAAQIAPTTTQKTYAPTSIPSKIARMVGINEPQKTITQGIENIGIPIVNTAAQIIDAVISTFSARKSAQVTTAEGALTEAFTALDKDIDNVKSGLKRPDEAQMDFNLAEASLNRLERTTKGLGKVNLRYWLGGGKEIETTIILSKQRLIDLRLALLTAAQQAATAQITAKYG